MTEASESLDAAGDAVNARVHRARVKLEQGWALTAPEIAALFRLAPSTVRLWFYHVEPVGKQGRSYVYSCEDVRRVMEGRAGDESTQ